MDFVIPSWLCACIYVCVYVCIIECLWVKCSKITSTWKFSYSIHCLRICICKEIVCIFIFWFVLFDLQFESMQSIHFNDQIGWVTVFILYAVHLAVIHCFSLLFVQMNNWQILFKYYFIGWLSSRKKNRAT